jgi:hypothetical protein
VTVYSQGTSSLVTLYVVTAISFVLTSGTQTRWHTLRVAGGQQASPQTDSDWQPQTLHPPHAGTHGSQGTSTSTVSQQPKSLETTHVVVSGVHFLTVRVVVLVSVCGTITVDFTSAFSVCGTWTMTVCSISSV